MLTNHLPRLRSPELAETRGTGSVSVFQGRAIGRAGWRAALVRLQAGAPAWPGPWVARGRADRTDRKGRL